ncbi:MAG TPA: AbrB/MazE/SpoVT family DNA-binding domain-containing protein [Candidatus Thermoplasmatota archaeon]|nr:AbrB/MazE/SpoVT family DNA-binding domain-containing protein [Candidatus Thermoplasmatota archaeon]
MARKPAEKPNLIDTLRRIDPQYRVSLPESVREALGVDRDEHVVFEIEGSTVRIRKARITVE